MILKENIFSKNVHSYRPNLFKLPLFITQRELPLFITLWPFLISTFDRSKTSPNERIMSSLHVVIKRPLKGFAVLSRLPIPEPVY